MTTAAATPPSIRHGAITAVVCTALAAVMAAMSSLNVAIPDIARSTHASSTQLSWIIDAYSLVFASFLLPGGLLGDRYGRRRLLIVGLIVFAIGSGAAMFASDARVLIGLRAVIGLGAALVMPATLSTITGTFPEDKRTKAVSIWAGVAGGAAVLGVVISGALLEVFSWRSVFGVNVVLAVVALIGTVVIVPESADKDAPRLDLGGALLSIVALVALVYSIIQAPDAGWVSARTLVGIGLGIVFLIVLVLYEFRQEHPMLDPRIFRRHRLSGGSISIFIQFFAFYGFIFLFLQYLQLIRKDSALIAAVSVLPMAATMLPVSRASAPLAARFGSRQVCAAGLILIAGALVIIAQVHADTSYGVLAVGLLVLGAGMGLAMTPATTAITSALPRSQQGVASAMNDLSREVGGALGIAVLGSILIEVYRNHLHLAHIPPALAAQAKESVALATHLGGPVAASAGSAFVDGLQIAFYAAAGAIVLAAVAVMFLLPRRDPIADDAIGQADVRT